MRRPFAISIAILSVMMVSFKSRKLKTPPGTVLLKEGLYIDKTEIANVHWREFVFFLQGNHDIALSERMLPDTTVWARLYDTGSHSWQTNPYSEYYFRHPAFSFYPVVGISYDQATAFCQWRTQMVNTLFEKDPSSNPLPGRKYRYRLPTEKEWEQAAAGKLDVSEYPFGYTSTVGTKGLYKKMALFNCKYPDANGSIDSTMMIAPVKALLPNSIGTHTMIGNVAEMIAEKGVAKGGYYLLPLQKCNIANKQTYTNPTAWLGFRCICEVVAE